MFDIAPTELLLCAVVALLVIGPKDLPKAMRVVGHWVGRARGVARHFRAGFDTMVREAELEEMEKKWREENARIMSEHPADPPADTIADPAPDLVVVPEPVEDAIAPIPSEPVVMAATAASAPAAPDAPAMLPMPLPEGAPKPKRTKKA
ncbi:Sec-independent protein translocase protein TatB [Sphingobium boeckii]|uniref:Sec-independent protein translocase protein TatB n=1 Tax=Sphingobium boeckii TaxID=1082345 RepID=A0A7W9EFI3_9SPHN|nr:Sec-independent protein translocase protein TatB [Sphingobium boeckii]MBB5686060.1 sec-independent protein translocase protein TatB [Sphingobium boeckii]